VIQLLGSHVAADIRRFALRHGIEREAATFTTRYRDRPWHVLVYGIYTSREAARRDIERLPRPLRQASPWARSIGSIREAISP
jgi:septal ring-binding cell division protein DamX